MRREVLRVDDLSAKRIHGCNLEHIHMNLYEGEVLGIVGLHNSGKSFFLDCLTGMKHGDSGSIGLYEEMVLAKKWNGSDKIFHIQNKSALVETLSVTESVFVIRRKKRKNLFVPWKALHLHVVECMREFEIDLDPEKKIYELSLVERHMVEILKGYALGAKLILIDDVLTPYTVIDYSRLDKVIRRFQEKGISFIICGCQLNHLQRLTDRCLFLINGSAVKVIDNIHRKQIDEMKILMGSGAKRLETYTKSYRTDRKNTKVLFEMLEKSIEKEECVPLRIREGEIVVVVDVFQKNSTQMLENFKNGNTEQYILEGVPIKRKDKRVYFADFLNCDYMIDSLTFRDNLCIAAYRRISTLGYLNPVKAKVVEKIFREQYQINSEHYEFNWRDMSFAEKMAVYLERIKLQRWKLMICTNIENVMSYELESMVKEQLRNMVKGKRAICIFASSFEKYADFADYFLLETGDGIYCKFSCEELYEYFGI